MPDPKDDNTLPARLRDEDQPQATPTIVSLSFPDGRCPPGVAGSVRLQAGRLTIGRDPSNDLVLPDPYCRLSKRHCVIEDRAGQVTVMDLSTNGTFLNHAQQPLGRGLTALSDGDVLSLGAYDLIVAFAPNGAAVARDGAGPEAPEAAARAFLAALGVEDLDIADADLPAIMARAGGVMRSLVSGIRDILMTRSAIKSEFQIAQTQIAARGNNPLKFAIGAQQAIEALIDPKYAGALSPEQSASQVMNDIAAHELAMVAGMETAIKASLAKLSPEVLADRIEQSGQLPALLRGRKAQYWDVYEKMFAELSDQAENDFHAVFGREFARAYSAQMDRMKAE